ncbi:MAG: hypothetical protein K6T26_01720 [Alicyclobacillus sp.]|nr:hypothetical protein [Alicyclobacillus sp.]
MSVAAPSNVVSWLAEAWHLGEQALAGDWQVSAQAETPSGWPALAELLAQRAQRLAQAQAAGEVAHPEAVAWAQRLLAQNAALAERVLARQAAVAARLNHLAGLPHTRCAYRRAQLPLPPGIKLDQQA